MSQENNPFNDQNDLSQLLKVQNPPTYPAPSNYQVPVELVSLPSKGLVYPIGHPLSNEETVEIKSMTAREEDILTSRALIKNGTVISQLMKSCVLNKLIDPDDMLSRG